jgi:hypothetical protein
MSGLTKVRIREIEEEIEERIEERDDTNVLLQELLNEVKRLQGDMALASEIKRDFAPPWLHDLAEALTDPRKITPTLNWTQALQEVRRVRTRLTKVVELLREIGVAEEDES